MKSEPRWNIIGPVRAWVDDTEIKLGNAKQVAVLVAILCADGMPVTHDYLIDAVWGENPPESASPTLRTYIYRLRRALGDENRSMIASSHGGYAIEVASDAVDLRRFKRLVALAQTARLGGDSVAGLNYLAEGLALAKGEPLMGVPGPFATAQRNQIIERRLSALEMKMMCLLDLGHHHEAAGELSSLTYSYPLRERFRELMMVALFHSGRQAEALAVFTETRLALLENLGIDPGRRLKETYQSVLQGNLDVRYAAQISIEQARMR